MRVLRLALFGALFIAAPALAILRGLPAQELQESDLSLLRAAVKEAVQKPEGTTVQWENPDTGNRGEVTHLKSGTRDGRECRLLELRTVTHSGEENALRHPLCQQPDGTWKLE